MDDKDRAALKEGLEHGAETASRAAVGIADDIKRGVRSVADTLGKAERALAAPVEADVAKLIGSADLPELADDGLASLLVRLDRESDLMRGLAVRTLARAAWVGRFAVAAVLVGALGELALATLAGFLAVLGGENLGARGGLVALAMVAVLAGAWFGARHLRETEAELRALSERLLSGARDTETRLARVGVTAAFRACGTTEYQVALARLEYELSQKREPT